MKFVSSRLIYSTAAPYDEDRPEFDCYAPADSGPYWILDCWVCDSEGNVHPDYDRCPVPVNTEALGDPVANVPVSLMVSARDWEEEF